MRKKTVYFNDWWGSIRVTLKGQKVRRVFTEGECGALAKALNHITGCKMISTARHAAVITFDGQVLDIEGLHTPSEFERKWGRAQTWGSKEDAPPHQNGYGVGNWHKAIPFAQLLVKKYLR
ncbi:hypothetical protein LCGC14_1528380 [marine sediment metagenome]|uniref:Uncharacterized protein n=1 Tax=marine sediment metagenome TaxID=412755 RepID=A0A0F9JHJ4_9ZZZZ